SDAGGAQPVAGKPGAELSEPPCRARHAHGARLLRSETAPGLADGLDTAADAGVGRTRIVAGGAVSAVAAGAGGAYVGADCPLVEPISTRLGVARVPVALFGVPGRDDGGAKCLAAPGDAGGVCAGAGRFVVPVACE